MRGVTENVNSLYYFWILQTKMLQYKLEDIGKKLMVILIKYLVNASYVGFMWMCFNITFNFLYTEPKNTPNVSRKKGLCVSRTKLWQWSDYHFVCSLFPVSYRKVMGHSSNKTNKNDANKRNDGFVDMINILSFSARISGCRAQDTGK